MIPQYFLDSTILNLTQVNTIFQDGYKIERFASQFELPFANPLTLSLTY